MAYPVSKCGFWKIYGNENPKVLIAGHSHTFSLLRAMTSNQEFNNFFGLATRTNLKEYITNNDEYWEFVKDNSKKKSVAILWNGNQHNIHFLVDANLKFNSLNFFMDQEYPYVTLSRIEDLFRPTFYELETVLEKFKKKSDILLVGTPPPKSKDFLDQRLTNDPFFLEVGQKLGINKQNLRASSDALRVFMWQKTQDLMKNTADKFGCTFIPIPNDVQTSNLTLEEKYNTDDLTHANELYGAKMLDHLKQFVSAK